jgi:Putative peptidoglycan binding domain
MADTKPTVKTTRTSKTTTTSTASPGASGAPQTEQLDPRPRPQPVPDVSERRVVESPRVESAAPPPEASPRLDIRANSYVTARAFHTHGRSRTVGIVQYVLRQRGFDPGPVDGVASYQTRAAYAAFQRSIGEAPTGVPTADSLDVLGFDVVG